MTVTVPGSCLILGGARSGKTRHALKLAENLYREQGLTPVYLATAQAYDLEMKDRIARHKEERGAEWKTLEVPLDLAETLIREASPDQVLLVDCLTLWLSNMTFADRDIFQETRKLVQSLKDADGPVIVVSNEVGLSIVPENALARRFRDDQGRLNQAVAAAATRVEFVAAGLPLTLKANDL